MESLIIINIIILYIIYCCIYEKSCEKSCENYVSKTIDKKNKKAIILHFANWCGYCKQFKPTWENIKKYCKENGYLYYEIDHTDNDNPIISPKPVFNISLIENSFPTLYLYNDGKLTKYEGEREYNDIINLYIKDK